MRRETGGVSMKKKNGYLILGLIFIVFTVISFVPPFTRTAVFWLSYLFGLLAIGIQVPIWNKMLKGESLKSRFLGFPILYIGVAYLIVQLVLSVIMMAVPGIPIWIACIVDVVILAGTCLFIVSGNVAKSAIEKSEEKIQTKTGFIKQMKADVDVLLTKESDPQVKKELSALANDIRYSDPMSGEETEEIEERIAMMIASLASGGDNKSGIISEIRELVKQRNIKCKAFK